MTNSNPRPTPKVHSLSPGLFQQLSVSPDTKIAKKNKIYLEITWKPTDTPPWNNYKTTRSKKPAAFGTLEPYKLKIIYGWYGCQWWQKILHTVTVQLLLLTDVLLICIQSAGFNSMSIGQISFSKRTLFCPAFIVPTKTIMFKYRFTGVLVIEERLVGIAVEEALCFGCAW